MAFAHIIVIKIMRRGDFDTAGTKFRIHIIVGNNRNFPVSQGQFDGFTNHILIAFIIGVNGDCGIAQHGFRTGGGDYNISAAVTERITHMPEVAVFFFGNNFQIGYCRMQNRIPVDQTFAAVNQAFFIQADKHFLYGLGQPFVHGKTFTFPV